MEALRAALRRFLRTRFVQRPGWLLGFLLVALVACGGFALGARSAWGVAAALLFGVLLALGLRRQLPPGRLGRDGAQTWVQLHVYGGALFALVLAFHTAGGAERGPLLAVLEWLSWALVISGFLGVVLRQWLPRVLASGLTTEVLYERIPELVAELGRRVDGLEATGSPPLADSCRRLAPELARPRRHWRHLIEPGAGRARQAARIEFLRPLLPESERPRADELAAILATKLELDAHWTLQGLLRGWLVLHVPLAFAAAVLVVFHLVTVFLY